MSQLVAFYHIDTEAEFLLKTVLADSASTVIGNFNPVNGELSNSKNDGTKPDIPWNSLVFIKDRGSIYYNRTYYSNNTFNIYDLIFRDPNDTGSVYITGLSQLLIGRGNFHTMQNPAEIKLRIIQNATLLSNNNIQLAPYNTAGFSYINCAYPSTVTILRDAATFNTDETRFLNDKIIFSDSSIQMHGVKAAFDVSAFSGNIRTNQPLRITTGTAIYMDTRSVNINTSGYNLSSSAPIVLANPLNKTYLNITEQSIDCSTVSFFAKTQSTAELRAPGQIRLSSSDASSYLSCILTNNNPQVSLLDGRYTFDHTGFTANNNIIVQSRSLMEYTTKILSISSSYINDYVRILNMQNPLNVVYKGEIIIHLSGVFIKYEWRKLGTSLNYYMKMTLSDPNLINDIKISNVNGYLNVYLKFNSVYTLPYRIEYFSDITKTDVASPTIQTAIPTGATLSTTIKNLLNSMTSAVLEGINGFQMIK